MTDTDSRTWEVERDRFGVYFSGPLEVGECREVIEASAYRLVVAERDRLRRALEQIADDDCGPWDHALRYARAALSVSTEEENKDG